MFCGTDYLAMSNNDVVVNAMIQAASKYGAGSGGTRNIAGNYTMISELEREVAHLHKKEAALVFSSGYLSNFASVSALGSIFNGELLIFSDELNHSSIIEGIKASRCKKFIFRHNDEFHLRELLSSVPYDAPKIIVFESIYSMNGVVGKIKEFAQLAKEFNAMTFIDEVHAIAVYGKHGGGICEELGLEGEIDIIQASFSKGYGVNGGYITGNAQLIDAIRSEASGFIFTSTMPIPVCAACLASVRYLKHSQIERQKYFKNLSYILALFERNGIKLFSENSHIISIKIGDALLAKMISKHLLHEYGIYVQHINYPTVARGSERLRVSITPMHTFEMIDEFMVAIKSVLEEFGILQMN